MFGSVDILREFPKTTPASLVEGSQTGSRCLASAKIFTKIQVQDNPQTEKASEIVERVLSEQLREAALNGVLKVKQDLSFPRRVECGTSLRVTSVSVDDPTETLDLNLAITIEAEKDWAVFFADQIRECLSSKIIGLIYALERKDICR